MYVVYKVFIEIKVTSKDVSDVFKRTHFPAVISMLCERDIFA